MPGIGQQVSSGLGDFGKAVSSDVLKGVGQVAKDTLVGSVESLSGVTLTPNSQAANGTGNNEADQMRRQQEMKAKFEQARRTRLSQVQNELEQYVSRELAKKNQAREVKAQQEEQTAQAEEKQEESAKKLSIRNLIKSATKGTGEKTKNKF